MFRGQAGFPPLEGLGWLRTGSRPPEELTQRNLEGIGDPIEQVDGGVRSPTFEAADIGPIDLGVGGELILRQAAVPDCRKFHATSCQLLIAADHQIDAYITTVYIHHITVQIGLRGHVEFAAMEGSSMRLWIPILLLLLANRPAACEVRLEAISHVGASGYDDQNAGGIELVNKGDPVRIADVILNNREGCTLKVYDPDTVLNDPLQACGTCSSFRTSKRPWLVQ